MYLCIYVYMGAGGQGVPIGTAIVHICTPWNERMRCTVLNMALRYSIDSINLGEAIVEPNIPFA